jgi:hypothetical protein
MNILNRLPRFHARTRHRTLLSSRISLIKILLPLNLALRKGNLYVSRAPRCGWVVAGEGKRRERKKKRKSRRRKRQTDRQAKETQTHEEEKKYRSLREQVIVSTNPKPISINHVQCPTTATDVGTPNERSCSPSQSNCAGCRSHGDCRGWVRTDATF